MQHIIDGVKDALVFTILCRSVGTRHLQMYPFGGKECMRGDIIELTAIVALDGFDGAAKLCGGISEKIDKVEKVLDLMRKGKVHIKWE
jgi:hypothetical protein